MQSPIPLNQSPLRMHYVNNSANYGQVQQNRSIMNRINETLEKTLNKIDRMDNYSNRLQSITERQNTILKKLKQSNLPKHLERYTQKLRIDYLRNIGEDVDEFERKLESEWEQTLSLSKKYRDELRLPNYDDSDEESDDDEEIRRRSRRKTRKTKFSNFIVDNTPSIINQSASNVSNIQKKQEIDQSTLLFFRFYLFVFPQPKDVLLGKVVIELKPPLPSLYPRYLKRVDIMKLSPEERK